MSRIDYFSIEESIEDILKASSDLSEGPSDVTVLVEEDISFAGGDIIQILLKRRDAPEENQPIASGTITRYDVTFSIWCYGYALERREAMKRRDDLVGKVEIVLQSNRMLGLPNLVNQSWFTGGDFENVQGPEESGDLFLSGAEIELVCDVKAIST